MDTLSPTKIHWWTRIKSKAFASLEFLVNSGNDYHASVARVLSADNSTVACNDSDYQKNTQATQYLWVYTATIGELHAISTLIDSLLKTYRYASLVILTDHEHYREAMQSHYPNCIVVLHGQSATGIGDIVEQYPPALLMIAEIPALMFDAPCRLSFKVLFTCKAAGALVVVVNGWLYHEFPSCRIDRLEQSWFQRDYLTLIDHCFMQTSYGQRVIIQHNMDERRTTVTGNLKFDALSQPTKTDSYNRSDDYRVRLNIGSRPTIVCGCVTNINEQKLIISAFRSVKKTTTTALLILAPRHPENKIRMEQLESILDGNNLRYQFRSSPTSTIDKIIDVLVLDSIGELKDFYAIGDVCYVGLNHNILEPLNFQKTVVVTPGWDPKYPSYPVYVKLLENHAILQCKAEVEIVAEILSNALNEDSTITKEICLNDLKGSLNRHLQIIEKILKA